METKPELDNANVVSSVLKPINDKKQQNLIIKEYENNSVTKNKYELFWENQGTGKPSQVERYEQRHAPDYILRFIRIGGGPRMGTTLEQFARFVFGIVATFSHAVLPALRLIKFPAAVLVKLTSPSN